MKSEVEKFDSKVKDTLAELALEPAELRIPLSVPYVAAHLIKGRKHREIARMAGVSRQAVTDYIRVHKEEFEPLLDTTDGVMAMKVKYIASQAGEHIIKHLPHTTKKDLIALNAISGTHTDKYLALSGKAPIEGAKLVFNVVFNDNRGGDTPTTIECERQDNDTIPSKD